MKRFLLGLIYTMTTVFSPGAFAVERIVTADLIEGQSSVKNYMGNKGHFEKNANGMVSYADAAATSPVDGTGGSATNTCTQTTSSPLAGVGSFLITHGGTNRQGDGCAASFSIDSKDKAKVIQITFDYLVASGTYADGDQTVWVYDVTNSRLIQPTGTSILNASVAQKKVLEFQTSSDSVSYRLIFHTASTSTSSYTVKIDDIMVSPFVAVLGSSTTDWKSFTPTGGWSTNTTWTGMWRRVGDSMQVQAKAALAGAPNSASFSVNLPTGYTIDTAKLTSSTNEQQVVGSAMASDFGTGYHAGSVLYSTTTSVTVISETASVWTQAVPQTWAASDVATVNFIVPIVGWGTAQVLSSDTDTRVVSFNGTNSGTQSVTANTTDITVTTTNDSHGAWATNIYTAKVPGDYVVAVTTADTVAAAAARVYKNGSASNFVAGGPANNYWGGSTLITGVKAGDTLSVRSNTTGTLAANTNISIYRLSGPAQVAASEDVNAAYKISGDITPSINSQLDFATKIYDSHGAVTTGSSWAFTAPIPGLYQVCITGATSSTGGTIDLYTNGVQDRALFSATASGTLYSSCASVKVLAGQTLDARVDSASKTFTNTKNNTIYIRRVGNY